MTRPRSTGRAAGARSSRRGPKPPAARLDGNGRRWALVGSGIAVLLIAIVVGWGLASNQIDSGSAAVGPGATASQAGVGRWTNITPDGLASMLVHKDFTLLNVKTPYIGEIAGTDLYIPYTDVAARAAELPADKATKVVVYCRSGHESAIAAQTLVGLGYTNIDSLDGGMAAWTASGRRLIEVAH